MNHNKHILMALCLPFLLFSSSSSAMLTPFIKKTTPWLQEKVNHEEKLKKIKSIKEASEIDIEINNIKKDLYREVLTELNNITDSTYSYNNLQKQFDYERELVKKILSKENPHTIQDHGDNFPSSIYQDLIATLKEKKINPANIQLKYKINSKNNTDIAYSLDKNLFINFYPIKPRICIYDTLYQRPKNYQLFVYHHELAHLLLRHGAIKAHAIMHDSTTNRTKLNSIKEREADIHAAATNSILARTGMQERCFSGHAQILNKQSHCYDMQIMYELMKQKEKLTISQS